MDPEGAGRERVAWVAEALQEWRLTALVCTLPENVLMLTGYWPVVGTAVAVATRDGVSVLAPADEEDLARRGWSAVRTYYPGSLTELTGPADTVGGPLSTLLHEVGATDGAIGYDDGRTFEGSSYAAMYRFAAIFPPILESAAPRASLQSAWGPLAQLRSRLTPHEVDRVRLGCAIAGRAYEAASRELRPGLYEPEAAVAFEAPLATDGLAQPGVTRARGFVWCMSGPNSALAGAAYAQSRHRAIEAGDLVLIHCNSYVDGYWTDVTRTYCMGEPDERQCRMYEAVLAARTAALEAIRPGARAADVDAAAREVLADRGFGEYFTHGLGHNLGFSVISNEFPPRLHPASPDVLDVGMTFNVEPSIYVEGYGGIRHCDVVTVGEEGAEVLTPFAASIEDLTVS